MDATSISWNGWGSVGLETTISIETLFLYSSPPPFKECLFLGGHPTSTVSSLRIFFGVQRNLELHSEGQHYPGKAVWIFCETGAASPMGCLALDFGMWNFS